MGPEDVRDRAEEQSELEFGARAQHENDLELDGAITELVDEILKPVRSDPWLPEALASLAEELAKTGSTYGALHAFTLTARGWGVDVHTLAKAWLDNDVNEGPCWNGLARLLVELGEFNVDILRGDEGLAVSLNG